MGPPGAAAVKRGWSDGACADMVLAGDLWLSVKARGAPPATAAGKLPPSSSRCNGAGTFPSLGGGKDVGQGEGKGRRGARECCVRCGFSCPPPRDVLLQYSEEALVHGVHYFTKQEISCAERLLWMAAVAVCAVFAVVFMHIAWVKFMDAPITTTVKTTFYPLYRLPFAAVTVCPATNVRRTVAEELLMQHLGERRPNETLQRQMWHVMAVLSKLQHPFFHTVDAHLEAAAPLVPRLQTLNISNFMLKGSEVSCCEEFRLQRYDGGLCYSFNSLTSDEKNG
ncbi:sodium channel protein Nach-like, partial [Gryllus bimaculatus]